MIGSIYALLRTRLGMPSFVSTLSGLLALLGLQLWLLGNTGSINLPYGSWMVNFGQLHGDAGVAVARAGARARRS